MYAAELGELWRENVCMRLCAQNLESCGGKMYACALDLFISVVDPGFFNIVITKTADKRWSYQPRALGSERIFPATEGALYTHFHSI